MNTINSVNDSRVVAFRWKFFEEDAWRVCVNPPVGAEDVDPLVPISMLAEAESALKSAQENEDIEYALRVKAESRLVVLDRLHDEVTVQRDALQSRLDAVVAAVAKHRDTFPDEALPSELELWESIATLGCATTGEGGT